MTPSRPIRNTRKPLRRPAAGLLIVAGLIVAGTLRVPFAVEPQCARYGRPTSGGVSAPEIHGGAAKQRRREGARFWADKGPRHTERAYYCETGPAEIRLCQALWPAAPYAVRAVDCATCPPRGRRGWEAARLIAWQQFAQGEYVGHARTAHVPEYRLRVDDELDLVYRLTRAVTDQPYRLEVGDEVRVESMTDPDINADLLVQPDGTITLPMLHQVLAAGLTVAQLTDKLDELYKKFNNVPAITVTPLKVNTRLQDFRDVVDSRYGRGGQSQLVRVTPAGNIALPLLGSVRAQGLTLDELRAELNARYDETLPGIEVIPVLNARAPRFVYVLGEVAAPGRFELVGPTTVLQALSMAGSWNTGAYLKHVVIFRRGDDWRLLATMVDVKAALHGNEPCPAGELWLNDSDVVLVPKNPILRTDEAIDLLFTRGLYGVLPTSASLNFSKLSSL